MFDNTHHRKNLKSFRQCLKILKKKLPPAYPVKIEYKEVDDFGTCELIHNKKTNRYKFIITINIDQCEDLAIETLIHEWAHMLSWAVGNNWYEWGEFHGPEWGIAFSKIYQVLYDK